MAYSTDEDLQRIRSTIMSLGIDDWSDFHDEAATDINSDIEVKWYRKTAALQGYDWRFTPFDADLLLSSATQLLDLSCYRTLFLIYRYLAQDTVKENDAYAQQRDYWEAEHSKELTRVIEKGLDYDWGDSGEIESYEKSVSYSGRRVKRV